MFACFWGWRECESRVWVGLRVVLSCVCGGLSLHKRQWAYVVFTSAIRRGGLANTTNDPEKTLLWFTFEPLLTVLSKTQPQRRDVRQSSNTPTYTEGSSDCRRRRRWRRRRRRRRKTHVEWVWRSHEHPTKSAKTKAVTRWTWYEHLRDICITTDGGPTHSRLSPYARYNIFPALTYWLWWNGRFDISTSEYWCSLIMLLYVSDSNSYSFDFAMAVRTAPRSLPNSRLCPAIRCSPILASLRICLLTWHLTEYCWNTAVRHTHTVWRNICTGSVDGCGPLAKKE